MTRWQPRDASSYAHALLALLPLGEVWTRSPDAVIVRVLTALAGVVGRWAARVGHFLVTEAFPPTAIDLLSDWERVLGLPEPCLPETDDTIAERQAKVTEKLRRRPGQQDPSYFIELAAKIGYAITITEYIPAQCAMTPCGAYLRSGPPTMVRGAGVGTPTIRYVWSVEVTGPRLTWFATGFGGGRAALDPHLRIRRAADLECILRRFKPAHTQLIFSYSGV